ncbi:HNH endonuclease [Amycolatopsis japonica]|uniref:HNH endonuclease n=1 Tax=Amycolatopsis japonica TaxID=208439 RepID=UPI00378F37B1
MHEHEGWNMEHLPSFTDLVKITTIIDGVSKRCRKCEGTFPLAELAKDKSKSYGTSNICRPCDGARCSDYAKRNPDKVRAKVNRYRATDKGKAAASRGRHSRRAALAECSTKPYDRFDIYDRDNGLCHVCALPVARDDFHLDHLHPLNHADRFEARILGDTPGNVAPAHDTCNLSRGNREIAQEKLIELATPGAFKVLNDFKTYFLATF